MIGKGISYCATCDGSFYKNKDVAVLGSGATAVEDALYLANIVKKVFLINRSDSFKCDATMLDKLERTENIKIIYNNSISKLNGESKLTSIELTNHDLLDVEGLFIAIGYMPNNLIFKNFVDISSNGFIESDDTSTKTNNIFVAGDTRNKSFRQLITAASDGAIAASKAINFLNNK